MSMFTATVPVDFVGKGLYNEEILIKATNIATGKKDDTNIFDRFLLSPAQNIQG